MQSLATPFVCEHWPPCPLSWLITSVTSAVFRAIAGVLACHAALAGENGGVGEREDSGGRESEDGDPFGVHLSPGTKRYNQGGPSTPRLTAVVSSCRVSRRVRGFLQGALFHFFSRSYSLNDSPRLGRCKGGL